MTNMTFSNIYKELTIASFSPYIFKNIRIKRNSRNQNIFFIKKIITFFFNFEKRFSLPCYMQLPPGESLGNLLISYRFER